MARSNAVTSDILLACALYAWLLAFYWCNEPEARERDRKRAQQQRWQDEWQHIWRVK
jgi:hypothetical protein